MTDRYRLRGVSSSKEEVHHAVQRYSSAGLYPTAFCKMVEDFGDDPKYAAVMHADGAGTKSALAYLYWKETGDLSVWHGIAHDAVVMNVDDLLCVGITEGVLLSSTIGRNKPLVPGEVIEEIIRGTEDTLAMLRAHGFGIVSAGGETADVGDVVRTVIVDSAVAARIARKDVVANDRIAAGDVIVGLASFGKASYEQEYNSGIGSNGLTSARHDMLSKVYAARYPESFDPHTAEALVYAGACRLTDASPGLAMNIGKLLLSPTRTYAPVLVSVIRALRAEIHGMVHCSGGGQTKALRFLQGLHAIKDTLFPTPPLFEWIQQQSGASPREMYEVFNMGHRFELYVRETVAHEIIATAKGFGVEAQIVGRVVASDRSKVTVATPGGALEYTL